MSTKDAYVEKMEAQMQEWHAQIQRLKEQAELEKAAVKLSYSEQLDVLRAKQAAAQQKLREIKSSGDSAWEELKSGAEHVWDDLKQTLDHAIARFR